MGRVLGLRFGMIYKKDSIVVYGPMKMKKQTMTKNLKQLTEVIEDKQYVMGDFNNRVGKIHEVNRDIMGDMDETASNNNGSRLEYCRINNQVIIKSFVMHYQTHGHAQTQDRSEKQRIKINN